ncbi:tetratricopeptide repeat protein [Stutzerimonas kunmingensis]|uniref:tetratricopeptide repeat protein n=1 Tax=Stutzerimonas kunmingensis TaxID=1211807 RepID=UPI00052DC63A|nr:tetratricopeptide repeat protein [Stutzerimonas kunmingensis]OHC15169.1 MAG: hypothetical protein A2180_11200 [Pseudomonadales bacterium GWC2_63_15]CEG54680.1 hypothetical protein PXNS11_450005 [Stutzerimonas xanthomarina]
MRLAWLGETKTWIPSAETAFGAQGSVNGFEASEEKAAGSDVMSYVTLFDLATGTSPDANALNELGCIWLEGIGVERNWPVARALFAAAASYGSTSAYINLGHLHWFGMGVPINERKGLAWYRFAANRGSTDGLCELGHAHLALAENGTGATCPEMHLENACDCYLAAAQEGHPEAMSSLGHLLLDDRNHRQDEARGLYWLTYAAALGDPLAANRIADFFDEARIGLPDPGNLLRDFWRNYRRQRDAVAERDQFEQGSKG